jgi:peptidoglycan hydrolase-like protein with peptidoglycan-binding domain
VKTLRYHLPLTLLAGFGVIGMTACSNITGGTGQSSRATAASVPTVAPEMVRQVQSKLRDGGYYKQGAVDGVWGSGTETAVRSFQRDHSLTTNGQLDVPTLQALNIPGGQPGVNGTAANPDMSPATQPMRTDPNPSPADNAVPPSSNTAAPSSR